MIHDILILRCMMLIHKWCWYIKDGRCMLLIHKRWEVGNLQLTLRLILLLTAGGTSLLGNIGIIITIINNINNKTNIWLFDIKSLIFAATWRCRGKPPFDLSPPWQCSTAPPEPATKHLTKSQIPYLSKYFCHLFSASFSTTPVPTSLNFAPWGLKFRIKV